MVSTPVAGVASLMPASDRPASIRSRLVRRRPAARPAGAGVANEPARRPLRIVIFNPSYPPMVCGVGAYVQGLATALVHAGHDVTVVTGATATTTAVGPPRVWPLLREWSIGGFLRAWPRVVRTRPDIVVSGFPSIVEGRYSRLLYLAPGLAKALLGRPMTVFIVHEFVRTGEAERRRLRLALRAADRIVAVTEAERDGIVARYPWAGPRTVVRQNAPSIALAAPDPAADARARTTLAPPGQTVIAFFGLLWSSAKGFEDLLEALTYVDAQLVVTGSLDPANAYHAHLAAEIARLGLGERVRWLGFVADEVGRVLRAADVVVLPYKGGAESGYTTLLAALVNGAAVVTTRGPHTPAWLRDGETALLVDPSDPSALVRAIERLQADEGFAARLRTGASALSFGWDEIVEAVTTPTTVQVRSS